MSDGSKYIKNTFTFGLFFDTMYAYVYIYNTTNLNVKWKRIKKQFYKNEYIHRGFVYPFNTLVLK